MKHLGTKKLLIGILIAVSAIACFAGAGLMTRSLDKHEVDQGIHIAGLEYKDGWNLISDAEDYYLMTENTSTGANAGAKYRLTNDITIDPRKAKQDVFIGATLDGGGFNLNYKEDPLYVPEKDVKATKAGLLEWNYSRTPESPSGGSAPEFDMREILGYSIAAISNVQTTSISNNNYSISGLKTITLDDDSFNGDLYAWSVGGVYGVVMNATIENIRFVCGGAAQIDANMHYWVNYDCDIAVGGLCGYAKGANFYNCLVKYTEGDHFFVDNAKTLKLGAFVGIAYNCCFAKYNSHLNVYERNIIINSCGCPDGYEFSDTKTWAKIDECIELTTEEAIDETKVKNKLGDLVATTSYEMYSSSKPWVILPGINGGEVIQSYFIKHYYSYFNGILVSLRAGDGTLYSSGGFYWEWGYLPKKLFAKGSSLGTLPTPTAPSGYDFKGWSTQQDTYSEVPSNAPSDVDNVTYYAHYKPKQYFVIYNGNNATGGSTSNSTHYYGTNGSLRTNGFTRNGYEFVKWNTKADGSGTSYSGGASITLYRTTNLTLYAQWTPIQYTITYNSGGGAFNGSYTQGNTKQTYTIEDSITLRSGDIVKRENYGFANWVVMGISSEGAWKDGKAYSSGASISSGMYGNVTLSAQWIKVYDLLFYTDMNGAETSFSSTSYSEGYVFNNVPQPEKVGYTFNGWIVGETTATTTNTAVTLRAGDTYIIEGGHVSDDGHTINFGASWTPVNQIELVDPYGHITSGSVKKSIIPSTEFDGNDKIECKLSDLLDKSQNKIYVSVVAYMADWSQYSAGTDGMRLISCTEAGGWNISSGSGADAKLQFVVRDTGVSSGYLIASSNVKFKDMESGWHHIEGVFNGTYAYLYIDGELRGTSVALKGEFHYSNNSNNIDRIVIGAEPTSSAGGAVNYFKGKIESVFVANTKPSAGSIKYTPGSGSYQNFASPQDVNNKETTIGDMQYKYAFEDNTNLYSLLGWKLDNSLRDLDGGLYGEDIWFNGTHPDGFNADSYSDYNKTLLTGFDPKQSSGYARLFAVYLIINKNNPSIGGEGGDYPIIGGGNTVTIPDDIKDVINSTISLYTITLNCSDGSLEGYTAERAISVDGNIITYNQSSVFDLPTATHMKRYGYTFIGWKLTDASKNVDNWKDLSNKDSILGDKDTAYKVSGMYGNITLTAQWDVNTYDIIIHSNVPGDDETKTIENHIQWEEYTLSLNTIFGLGYNIETNGDHKGDDYTFIGWAITSGNNLNYADIYNRRDCYSSTSIEGEDKRSESINTAYKELEANFNNVVDEKTYSIILKDGSSISKLIHGDLDVNQEIHIYAIWSPIYTVTIEANMGIESHKHADDEDCKCGIYIGNTKQSVDAYEVNQIDRYDSSETIYSQHYNQGYELYIQGDNLVFNTPQATDVGFNLHLYGHYINGWIIQAGGKTYYLEEKTNGEYEQAKEPGDWKSSTSVTPWFNTAIGTNTPINLQYIQGNITLIPQWTPMQFAVVFQTEGDEDYKNGYDDPEYSLVTFGDKYIVKQDANSSYNTDTKKLEKVKFNGDNSSTIYAVDIKGYSVIYFEANIDNNLGNYITTPVALNGAWTYKMDYNKNNSSDIDADWCVFVEGYYMPDLYKVKLELDLPYIENNNFTLNNNDFVLETKGSLDNLYGRYPIKQTNTDGTEYISISEYEAYQHKIFNVGSEYYIYLLQDQVMGFDEDENSTYIQNRYEDGKEISNYEKGDKTYLPTFEIDYYQMQYYFTYAPNSVVTASDEGTSVQTGMINRYQMSLLDQDHIDYATSKMEKYPNAGSNAVTEGQDWKYTYNNDHDQIEGGHANAVMHVYWYRNIVQLDVNNLLESNNSPNGYTLITENEQVRDSLEEHYQYHLIVVTNYGEMQSEYVVFGFNDLDLLKNDGFYKYIQLLQKDGSQYTADYVNLEGLIGSKLRDDIEVEYQISTDGGKYLIPIYFGNSFTMEAVDQSKDHSVDEFIGYRFNNYTYTATDKEGVNICTNEDTTLKRVDIKDTANNDLQNGTTRIPTINLKTYEEGISVNYFRDKDILTINTHFAKIKYVFNFITSDSGCNLYAEAGNIRVDYDGPKVDGMVSPYVSHNFDYTVNVNNDYNIRAYMNIELGYEHLSWKFDNNGGYLWDMDEVTNNQTAEFMIDAGFLRAHYYNTYPYSADESQAVGKIYSICQKMQFSITVNILDQSQNGGTVINSYQLTTSDGLIGASADKFVINEAYVLNMLGDGYYTDGSGNKYALRSMYIAPVGNHSGKTYLVNEFEYPTDVSNYQGLQLKIDRSLLNKSIYYDQYVEVLESNRTLQLYLEVAPTIEVTFNIIEEDYDKKLGLRQISVGGGIDINEGVTISKAEQNGDSVAGASLLYKGYWGQQTLIKFKAGGRHYEGLLIDDGLSRKDLTINANGDYGNSYYQITEPTTITLTVKPRIYEFSVTVKYNGSDYYITDGDSFEDVKNLNGTQIFSTNPASGELDQGMVIELQNAYFYGDVVTLKYTLNQDLYDSVNRRWMYTIRTEINGVGEQLETKTATYDITFTGSDINVVMYVNPYKEGVTIQTDSSKNVGQIYVQINDRDTQEVSGQGSTFKLEVGEKLNIYVLDAVGFEFANTYSYSKEARGTTHDVVTEQVDLNGKQFNKFTLFNDGFQIREDGTYTLQFKQIPIEVSFKYYQSVPTIQEVEDAGRDYMVTYTNPDQYDKIEQGSVVNISKGTDAIGYGFSGYTYAGPEGVGKALNEQFTITEEVMNYLSGVEMQTNADGDKYIPLTIYVNYIKQYTFDIEYKCDESKVAVDITTPDGQKMSPTGYYNYGTAFKVTIKATDTDHYQVKVKINDDKIDNENQLGITDKVETNLNNLSGFTTSRNMIKDYNIIVDVVAEKYYMGLTQKAYEISTEVNEENTELTEAKEWFELGLNVYYRIEGTFEYGTSVEVQIYVKNPLDITKTYYKLTNVKVNGMDIRLAESVGSEGYIYTLTYKIEGQNLPTHADIEVNLKAMCYVKLELL